VKVLSSGYAISETPDFIGLFAHWRRRHAGKTFQQKYFLPGSKDARALTKSESGARVAEKKLECGPRERAQDGTRCFRAVF
jgi:hypothetical protein